MKRTVLKVLITSFYGHTWGKRGVTQGSGVRMALVKGSVALLLSRALAGITSCFFETVGLEIRRAEEKKKPKKKENSPTWDTTSRYQKKKKLAMGGERARGGGGWGTGGKPGVTSGHSPAREGIS